jgi:hypothetical protein
MKAKTIIVAAFVAVLALTTARAADLTPTETKAFAEEAFIYDLQIVMNQIVTNVLQISLPEYRAFRDRLE